MIELIEKNSDAQKAEDTAYQYKSAFGYIVLVIFLRVASIGILKIYS